MGNTSATNGQDQNAGLDNLTAVRAKWINALGYVIDQK